MDLFLLLFKCNIFFSNYSQSIIDKDPTSLMADYTFLRHLVSTSESAQCNRKSAICGLKNPIGQSSRSLAQTKRIVGSGDEIGHHEVNCVRSKDAQKQLARTSLSKKRKMCKLKGAL